MVEADGQSGDTRVAVIGTGIMGAAMASNLIAAGLPTTVWDRSPDATAPLADAGARVAASARDAAGDAQVVITMLPTADVVTSVMFGDGAAGALANGAVWAQMGTIGVTATAEIAGRLGQLRPGVLFVDAPVSGSKGPAQAGQLLILASGPQQAAPIVESVFSVIGRKTVWLGPAGRLGIDAGQFEEAIEGGPLDAPIAGAKLHKMERGDFAPEFPLQWALKDVDLAIAIAGLNPPPLLVALSRRWHAAVDAGHGREDVSAAVLALYGNDQ